jgi:hypothetical protein
MGHDGEQGSGRVPAARRIVAHHANHRDPRPEPLDLNACRDAPAVLVYFDSW